MRLPRINGALLCVVFLCGLAGCQKAVEVSLTADLVLRGGVIHTVDEDQPRAEALAVFGSEIIFVGTDDAAVGYIGPETEVVDLDGRLVLPGIAKDFYERINEQDG